MHSLKKLLVVQIYNNAQAMHEYHFGPNSAVEEAEGTGPRQVQGTLSFKVLAEIPISGLISYSAPFAPRIHLYPVTHCFKKWYINSNGCFCCLLKHGCSPWNCCV